MFPADFAYVRADSLPHALDLLTQARRDDADAKLIAGGQSLLPMMKLRLASPETLIDIGGITSLRGVTSNEDDGVITIGALTTYRDLERDPVITATYPAIADALHVLADQQVRARGTIGGCVAHGDPASDLPAVLLALDATVTITGPAGTRAVRLDDFLQGVFTTDLAADEIVTAITLPPAPPGQAYEKFEQPASHLPLAGACAAVEIKDGRLSVVKVAVTGVAPRPFRAFSAERPMRSAVPAPAVVREAASRAADGVRPLSDQHASGPYRLHLAEVVTRRALDRAIERARA